MDGPRTERFVERPTAIVAAEGWPFVVPLIAATALLFAFAPLWLALVAAAVTGFVVAFFRNPARPVPGDEATVVAPADGRVLCVDELEAPDGSGAKPLRIGIICTSIAHRSRAGSWRSSAAVRNSWPPGTRAANTRTCGSR